MSDANQYDYDDENGPPVCERCGEPCHHCEFDFQESDQ